MKERAPAPAGAPLDIRLMPVALVCWALAAAQQLWGVLLPLWSAVLALCLAALGLAVATGWRATARGRLLMVSLCLVAAGAGSVVVAWHAQQPLLQALDQARDGQEATVRLSTVQEPHRVAGRFGPRMSAAVLVRAARPCPYCAPVVGRVRGTAWWSLPRHGADQPERTASNPVPAVEAGSRSAASMPGGLPRECWARVRIRQRPGTLELTVVSVQAVSVGQERPGVLERARASTADRAQDASDADRAALVTGMAYGDDSGLSEQAREAMKTSGLTHLTAVSGSNVALVFLLGRHLVLWLRGPRILPTAIGLAAVGAYVLLVGPEPSVLRAAVMGTLGALAVAGGRGGARGAPLWAAVVLLTLGDPRLSVQPGFLLSVLATIGIVVSGPAATRCLQALLPGLLAEALALTLVASLWCTPCLLLLSGFWGPWGVLANLVVAPVVPWCTVTGILAVACCWCPLVADALVRASGLGAWWVQSVGEWAAGLPGARLEPAQPWAAAAGSCLLCGIVAVVLARCDPGRRSMMDCGAEHLRSSLDLVRSSTGSADWPAAASADQVGQATGSTGEHRRRRPR